MYIAHGFNHWFPIDVKHIIVSFHTNKHVNAPPQCDPAGVVGGRLIEYSEAMNRVQHSVQLNVECRRVLSVENTACTVLRCSVGADLLPPSNPPSPPCCRLTTSPICPAVPPPSPPYPSSPPYPPSSPPTPPPTSSPPPFAPAFPPANMLMILQGRMRII